MTMPRKTSQPTGQEVSVTGDEQASGDSHNDGLVSISMRTGDDYY